MKIRNQKLLRDSASYLLIALFLYLFLFADLHKDTWDIPASLLNVNTIFLSIILEAIPFIILGVFVSALIQVFVSEETVRKMIPKNPLLALLPASLMGIIFPVCECAIVPVVRRLIKKGMPLHTGIVFLAAGPVLNPVVFASTYYAFQSNPQIAYGRMAMAFVCALLIGLTIYLLFKNTDQLKHSAGDVSGSGHVHEGVSRWKSTFYHAGDEFFDMGKYLIFGAAIASLFQTFLDRSFLQAIGSSDFQSPAIMMAFAYVLSLCSEADAFVAASFGGMFSAGAILSFLVYGPMIDLKNTIMLLAYFRAKFVFVLILVITAVVYGVTLLYQALIL
ncbi:permease [Bacillus mangrovi]|uniref:Permease n=1 Tax=Metabacillus mangrovi TaxID=1491830 RepID=A0A7X2S6K8_9BACI|nr:permease [Metabacillus mangrovi]MTH54440.1 permease [Metabacillus mangrovi]